MKTPINAKVAKATADYYQHQFVNTWAMKRVLRCIKKKAKQGYYSCCIEIYKDEIELTKVNLEKLGFGVYMERDTIYDQHYAHISWEKADKEK